MHTRLHRFVISLLVMLTMTAQSIAGATMATQMATQMASTGTSAHHKASATCHDVASTGHQDLSQHDAHAMTNMGDALGDSCNTATQSHVKCAACLMFCSGLSVTALGLTNTYQDFSFTTPQWLARHVPSPMPHNPLRPPQASLS